MTHPTNRRHFLTHGACLAVGAGLGWLVTRTTPAGLTAGAAAQAADETNEERLRRLKLELPKVKPPCSNSGRTRS